METLEVTYFSQSRNIISCTFVILTAFGLVGSDFPTIRNLTHASEPSSCLHISEVYPAPNTGEKEWVEIWNCSDEPIDIRNFSLYDQLSTPSELLKFDTYTIEAHSFTAFDLPIAKLNNTGDGVILYNPTNQEIDQMSFVSTQIGKSWALIGDISGEFLLSSPSPNLPNPTPVPSLSPTPSPASTPTLLPTPTPTISQTIFPSPTAYPTIFLSTSPTRLPTPTTSLIDISKLQLTEVVACPIDSESEWLELFWSGKNTLEFTNWQIIDNQDNQIFINGSLKQEEYSVISWSKSILNNSGDKLKLLDQNQVTITEIELPACHSGQSFALIDNQFQLTNQITKGTVNPDPTSSPTPTAQASSASILGVSTSSTLNTQEDTQSIDELEQINDPTQYLKSEESWSDEHTDRQASQTSDQAIAETGEIELFSTNSKFSPSAITAIIGSLITIISSLAVVYEQKRQTQLIT